MTNLAANLSVQLQRGAPSGAINSEPPTFNTEQQFLIGSAAAIAGLKVRLRHLLAAMRAQFARAEKTSRPKHYPNRHYFIEEAAMSREMYRL